LHLRNGGTQQLLAVLVGGRLGLPNSLQVSREPARSCLLVLAQRPDLLAMVQ
jgi:hypothetical protein